MRILQVIHCFPPENMTGSEIYVHNLSKELSKKHKVAVFYRIKSFQQREYDLIKESNNGFNVYKINNRLKGYDSLEKIYRNKEVENRFSQVLDEVKPDIVHIHHLLFLSTGIVDEIKRRNIPIVFTLHDYWLVCPKGQLLKYNLDLCRNPLTANCLYCLGRVLSLKNLIKRLFTFRIGRHIFRKRFYGLQDVLDKVDLFISPSQFSRNRFIEFGVPPEKIIHSDNGMDFNLFKDIEKTKSDKIRFGFIGTLIPSKGAHVLIKAFNRIKGDRATLKIYGHSPLNNGIFDYYHRIKRIASRNKNISFMGTFDNKDIARIFKEIDVLVFSSLWQENAPLVLREAILTKTPVLASEIGGIVELINGVRFLFKRGDSGDLFEKMRIFIENHGILEDLYLCPSSVKSIEENSKEIEGVYKILSR